MHGLPFLAWYTHVLSVVRLLCPPSVVAGLSWLPRNRPVDAICQTVVVGSGFSLLFLQVGEVGKCMYVLQNCSCEIGASATSSAFSPMLAGTDGAVARGQLPGHVCLVHDRPVPHLFRVRVQGQGFRVRGSGSCRIGHWPSPRSSRSRPRQAADHGGHVCCCIAAPTVCYVGRAWVVWLETGSCDLKSDSLAGLGLCLGRVQSLQRCIALYCTMWQSGRCQCVMHGAGVHLG